MGQYLSMAREVITRFGGPAVPGNRHGIADSPEGKTVSMGTNSAVSKIGKRKPQAGAHASSAPAPRPVSAWDATDWQSYYDERVGIMEHDGGLSRQKAEAQAWECVIIKWMNSNPPADLGPHKCVTCGEPLDRIGEDRVPVLNAGGYVWVHHRCHAQLMEKRWAEAVQALAAMGMYPPAGWEV